MQNLTELGIDEQDRVEYRIENTDKKKICKNKYNKIVKVKIRRTKCIFLHVGIRFRYNMKFFWKDISRR